MRQIYIALVSANGEARVTPASRDPHATRQLVDLDRDAILSAIDDLMFGWSRVDVKQRYQAVLHVGWDSQYTDKLAVDFRQQNAVGLVTAFVFGVAVRLDRERR